MTHYFGIAPNSTLPDVKLYIPGIRYAKTDGAMASGLGQYLRLKQRDQYHDGFATRIWRLLFNVTDRSPSLPTSTRVSIMPT
ncbi:hypothetical protein PENARI_c042G10433 [Penicillium arizonense]|uniref:Uncharacterized protein n=1 Tax=Penicillium arizonense TaxID=1835702 RepID=A0A1F5L2T3_PENAI|nr:hypothetical protein PENARI_c042G10433 [Penicillium arizonense]OGE47533.1 hypothetical protein PENARI_c042G10433 [Penicillium arizonense]